MATNRNYGPLLRFFGFLVLFGALFGGYVAFKDKLPSISEKLAPTGKGPAPVSADTQAAVEAGTPVLKVCVNTWGGFAGAQWFNGGFPASKGSKYFTEYGILVEFKLMDDPTASRAAWKSGDCDLLWVTADAFSAETGGLPDSPKFFIQVDWSRGGDVIMVVFGINNVSELRGKKVAVALGTPSHTLLLKALEADKLTYRDLTIVQVPSGLEAAAMFKSGQVDAAVVWSPDDDDCKANVEGSKELVSTAKAKFIVADGFFVKAATLEAKRDVLVKFAEGLLRGNATLNTDPAAKEQAVAILATGLNVPADFARNAINKVRLATYGDNLNFFGQNPAYRGVTGEDLYSQMSRAFLSVGFINAPPPGWRNVTDTSVLRAITLTGPEHAAEGAEHFAAPTPVEAAAPAISSKPVSITFPTGSAVLDDNAKTILKMTFVDVAKQFGGNRIRVEGNTDSTGARAVNVKLSKQRAQAVADFLAAECGVDPDRFIVVGNGPDKPVATNDTNEGRAQNRRTDLQLL